MNEQRRRTLWTDINDEQWNNWHWQMSNRITSHKGLLQAMSVPSEDADQIEKCLVNFPNGNHSILFFSDGSSESRVPY